ncbi:MAG: hypothetical protein HY369_02385 [Candidatus Aenigmarchaeota archaeon]|nr:hypothetical protein [Candidatus Aenigmarchaeota archaeon]
MYVHYTIPATAPIGVYAGKLLFMSTTATPNQLSVGLALNVTQRPFLKQCNESLIPAIVEPHGEGFLQGDIVTISGFLTNGCGQPVEDAAVSYLLIPENSPSLAFSCTKTVNDGYVEDGGWYNCTRDTTNRPKGNYTVQMDAAKEGYPPNSTTEIDIFNLGNEPVLANPQVDFLSASACSESYQFSVLFTDADFNTNTLTLWQSADSITWLPIGQYLIVGISTTVYFVHEFSLEDNGLNYFKFNTTDEFGFTAETAPLNLTLDIPACNG